MEKRAVGLMPGGDFHEIVLNERERATLRSAASILGRIRDLSEDDADPAIVDIALAHYTCSEIANDGSVDA